MRHVEIFQASEKKREASERSWLGEEGACQGLCYPDGILQSAVNTENSLELGLSTQLVRKELQSRVLSFSPQRNIRPSLSPKRYKY